VFDQSQDKLEVMCVCMENGTSCPKTLTDVKSIDEVLNSGMKFPIIIKPRRGCGSRGFHRFDEESGFEPFIKENNIDLSEMVVQECLPNDSLVMSDNIFVDNDGNIKSSFLYGYYRFYPIEGGTGTLNITFNRSEIHEDCAKLVKLMNLRGCIGVDLMIDTRDDRAKVIKINPRSLACSKIGFLAGVNQAQQVLEKEFGQEVTPMMEYKSGIQVRMMQTDFLWFIKCPTRFKTKPSWFSWKNTSDQTFSWDDPLPWFAF
jgi:D-aspartate ligase